jgi:hypothetical protein
MLPNLVAGGRYTVKAFHWGHTAAEAQFRVDAWRKPEVPELVLLANNLPLAGVADAAGKPIGGVEVTLDRLVQTPDHKGMGRTYAGAMTTDRDGRFHFYGLPKGDYLLRATLSKPTGKNDAKFWAAAQSAATEFHAFAPRWQPLFWDLASLSPQALLDSAEEWLQTLAVVRAEDASSEAFLNVYNTVLERLEPLAAREPVRYYDLLRLILTWGLWRRPQEEREQIQQAAIASQREAVHREEIRTMGMTIAEWYVKEGRLQALRDTLRDLLEERFRSVPEALQQRIEATTDVEKLQVCLRQVVHIKDPQELPL